MSEAQVGVNVVDEKAAETEVSIEVKNIIEALIFASDEPMTVRMIRGIIDESNKDRQPNEQLTINAEIIRKAVADLNRGYGKLGSGFRIIEIAGGFVYATQDQFATWVGKLAKEKARRRLSPTAVETLAIIAYKQPITKVEVEFIRGVNVDYIINALLEKDLIHITGRQNSPGRPLLYGTTQKFLEHFGLNELSDLPKPREIADLINETEAEVDRRLLAEQQELEFRESLENKLEGHEGAAKKERTPKQPKVKVPDAVKAERAEKERVKKSENGAAQTNVDDQSSVNSDQSPVISNQESEVQLATKSVEAPAEEVKAETSVEEQNIELNVTAEETAEQKSDEVSLQNEIVEEIIEQQIETPIVVQERIEEEVEANVEPVVSSPNEITNEDHRISNINVEVEYGISQPVKVFGEEGVESSIHRGNITDGAEHPQHEASRQQEEEHEGGWSKWKNKVKTFFKKLFG